MLFLLLALAAGCLQAPPPRDFDGDGAGFSEDCDDTDPGIHPGAAEIWYDGVDQDCDGADDDDADADGYPSADHGGDDCDDGDPAVHPGAGDTWYDGVDQDCDGADDDDADADGYPSADHGGDDCDDADPEIHPGAGEVWYNGTDQDCDGASDYDADQDGHDSDAYGGDDCADDDAGIHPGAGETWYDGVDQDCDGADDYDADADGFRSADHGGDDCQDADPEAWPGAWERMNDQDDDCDGATDEMPWAGAYVADVVGTRLGGRGGTCGGLGMGVASGAVDLVSTADRADAPVLVPDPDGVADLLVAATSLGLLDRDEHEVFVVPGTTFLDGLEGQVVEQAVVRFFDSGDDNGFGAQVDWMDDLDGDGLPEVLVGAPTASWTDHGEAAIFLSTRFGAAGWNPGDGIFGLDHDQGGILIQSSSLLDNFGVASSLGDLDGDGLPDVAVGASGVGSAADPEGALYLYLDLDEALGTSGVLVTGDASVRVEGSRGVPYVGEVPTRAVDLDADGVLDLVVGAPFASDARGAVAIGAADLFVHRPAVVSIDDFDRLVTGYDGREEALAWGLYPPGDMDGDGYPDLAVSAEVDGADRQVVVLSGDILSRSEVTSTAAAGVVMYKVQDLDVPVVLLHPAASLGADHNGDGFADLVVGSVASDGGPHRVGIFWGDPGITLQLTDMDAAASVIEGPDRVGYLGAGGLGATDFTGDGLPELLVGAPLETDGGEIFAGALYLFDPTVAW